MYPTKSGKLFDKWPSLAVKIVDTASARNLSKKTFDAEASHFLTPEYLEAKDELAFLLVPLLIGTGAAKGRGESRYKPSKIECQQAFIVILEVSVISSIYF